MRTIIVIYFLLISVMGSATTHHDTIQLAEGVLDSMQTETLGLSWAKDTETVTVFSAADDTDHYANGVVMAAFKGKLYCMWQSSPKDEDSNEIGRAHV